MACSRLTIKAQEASLFTVSLAFVGRFEHDVVLLFLFLMRDNLFRLFQLRQKNLVFLWLLLFFPEAFEQVFTSQIVLL